MNSGYLALSTDMKDTKLVEFDHIAKMAGHALMIDGLGLGTSILKWVASFSAIYLLILEQTNWKTNMLTCFLVPYMLFTLPIIIFNFLRGDVAQFISVLIVIFRLFLTKFFPDWLEMPSSFVLIMVVAPSMVADKMRDDIVGVVFCLGIGCYLFQEHNRASGGFKKSFNSINGVANNLGIILLLVYPIWRIVLFLI